MAPNTSMHKLLTCEDPWRAHSTHSPRSSAWNIGLTVSECSPTLSVSLHATLPYVVCILVYLLYFTYTGHVCSMVLSPSYCLYSIVRVLQVVLTADLVTLNSGTPQLLKTSARIYYTHAHTHTVFNIILCTCIFSD